ncbi:transcription factor bHLH144-like [Neltuma alba]|uniref:transcription factor bHLH144-like n=1 Tax=Neltuma alba TaxID=207710 RepID=UPI0010A48963|nr:transcription factor bHLH144-like [Prosopis alba]XP_028754913.1 transcription factor bHLH144-like [Prosopis alba]XP_028754914.1 transcription factor bHLH144-like [Prosopis alba]XP_028786453.1 transcription factor bHLH144-like [Prosopis alba]XP_028786454.1 transcription factor bHLH144-like [Prosopis alba]XP_028786455.1 transcription factor bHLH144-like [Prosopis alba]XP_028786456.1 transcription factor bHLH144-like [Prosopis alba]
MQNHKYFYPEKFVLPLAPEAVDTCLHAPLVSALDAVLPSGARQVTPFERVELQPSEVCPKNFIIFDQTDNQSRIMFHPAMANKFSGPAVNVHAPCNRDSDKNKANPVEGELSSFEEDSKDIDALLSLEGEELEDHDEEEVSTARTNENYESICDTCSSYGSKSKKRSSSSVRKSSTIHGHCSNPEIKHWEMKRMIRVLRGIVPGGGDQMDSVTVLDEAVRYLKSLKVESEKLGVAL